MVGRQRIARRRSLAHPVIPIKAVPALSKRRGGFFSSSHRNHIKTMIKVSFVVTVYNKAPFLPGVIDALKNQQGDFEREYVFVNDGSTDNSWDIVKAETAGLPNVVLVDQVNQGVAIATNNGVRAASGDLIKLVDSDDILAPFCCQLLIQTLQDSNSDFVFAISGEHEETPVFENPTTPEVVTFDDSLLSVIKHGYARVSHCLFKKDLFDRTQGCDERIFSQDHSLFIRLTTHGKLAQVRHIVCSSPRDEPGRIMNNNAQVVHDATLALAYHLQDNPQLDPVHIRAAQKKITSRIWKWAKRELGKNQFSRAFWLFTLSRCGVTLSAKELVKQCAIFREGVKIRRP